jgi:acetoin utilization deacetylase AcuC-like enzyme
MEDVKSSGTGFILKEEFKKHVLSYGHPECPERLVEIQREMKQTGLEKEVKSISPVLEENEILKAIKEIHSEEHIASVKSLPITGDVAQLAVGCALGAVRDVCSGKIRNAFCPLRPPGHHAHNNGGNYDGPGEGEGFCFFNNVAVSAKYAQNNLGISRILIVDWDYHHGNGTEWSFYSDPSVLFFSTHQWYAYPGTGDPDRKGAGPGTGFNLNVPLASGAGDSEIRKAYERILIPAAEKFNPDLIFISAGFDSRIEDPLGTFAITDQGFAHITSMVMQLAHSCCNHRIVSFLEGGYNVKGVAKAAAAHLTALLK